MKKEKDIKKELFEICENFKMTEKEKEEISRYVDILSSEYENIQDKINYFKIVNLLENIELFKGKQDANKKDT